ncbi:HlyD family secretion protein, partial [Pseudoalteromonas sp. SR43-5]|jgi:HlyD family secretion protein|nr:HlyD family secretion protein [Pseudoalteromonas sp. SR43-5]
LEQSLVAQNIKKPNDFDNYSLWKVYEITPSSKAILTHINYKTTEQDTLSFDESLQGNYVLLLPAAYATQSYLDLKEVF